MEKRNLKSDLIIKWKVVWKLWSHVEVLSLMLSTHFKEHIPNLSFILLIHTFIIKYDHNKMLCFKGFFNATYETSENYILDYPYRMRLQKYKVFPNL